MCLYHAFFLNDFLFPIFLLHGCARLQELVITSHGVCQGYVCGLCIIRVLFIWVWVFLHRKVSNKIKVLDEPTNTNNHSKRNVFFYYK